MAMVNDFRSARRSSDATSEFVSANHPCPGDSENDVVSAVSSKHDFFISAGRSIPRPEKEPEKLDSISEVAKEVGAMLLAVSWVIGLVFIAMSCHGFFIGLGRGLGDLMWRSYEPAEKPTNRIKIQNPTEDSKWTMSTRPLTQLRVGIQATNRTGAEKVTELSGTSVAKKSTAQAEEVSNASASEQPFWKKAVSCLCLPAIVGSIIGISLTSTKLETLSTVSDNIRENTGPDYYRDYLMSFEEYQEQNVGPSEKYVDWLWNQLSHYKIAKDDAEEMIRHDEEMTFFLLICCWSILALSLCFLILLQGKAFCKCMFGDRNACH